MSHETTASEVIANREYKDTIFRMLFKEKKELLSLYNAVNGSHYTDPEALEIVTLENAVYMNMKNDPAFLLDFRLHLYEHQSSYSPNIPLRDLFYVAKEYQKLAGNLTLYASKPVSIPAPRFLVFYNGMEKRPARCVFKLSNLYQTVEECPQLELIVTMININEGHNQELMENCEALRQYMAYVDRVRGYLAQSDVSLQEAVERAINECIREGILADFLRKNRAEAISVSIFEYNEAEEKEKIRRAERELGIEQGEENGIAITRKLFGLLQEAGKTEDIIKAAQDEAYCKKLMREYGLR